MTRQNANRSITMPMKYINCIILFFIVVFMGMVAGCNNVDEDMYTGDGTLKKVGRWPFSAGYEITFGNIYLDKDFDKRFVIENFPKIGKTFDFCVRVNTNINELSKLKNGILYMKAYSENGPVFFEINDKISKWTISEHQVDSSNVDGLIFYFDGKLGSFIDSDSLKNINKIIFEIKLSDVQGNPSCLGEILLRVGGYK